MAEEDAYERMKREAKYTLRWDGINGPPDPKEYCRDTPLGRPTQWCGREPDHDGAHIHFGNSGVTAWGGLPS